MAVFMVGISRPGNLLDLFHENHHIDSRQVCLNYA